MTYHPKWRDEVRKLSLEETKKLRADLGRQQARRSITIAVEQEVEAASRIGLSTTEIFMMFFDVLSTEIEEMAPH
jgi:hypothetical protein